MGGPLKPTNWRAREGLRALSVGITPDGNAPDSDNDAVGDPDDFTVKLPACPTVNVVLEALVIAGAASTVNGSPRSRAGSGRTVAGDTPEASTTARVEASGSSCVASVIGVMHLSVASLGHVVGLSESWMPSRRASR